jgi:NAD-dependent DNA ligase
VEFYRNENMKQFVEQLRSNGIQCFETPEEKVARKNLPSKPARFVVTEALKGTDV